MSTSPAHQHSSRRRAQQACLTCAKRKTRCDEAKPKCSYCAVNNTECVYLDPQPPRLEPNTQAILDRIHQLEDRLFSTAALQGHSLPPPSMGFGGSPARSGEFMQVTPREDTGMLGFSFQTGPEVQAPAPHTAGSTYIYELPIVQKLLARSEGLSPPSVSRPYYPTPTSVFFQEPQSALDLSSPPESWRLFRDETFLIPANSLAYFTDLIHRYFQEVNHFFPLLSTEAVLATLDAVFASEIRPGLIGETTSPARYCLLLLVLCLASFVSSGLSQIRLHGGEQTNRISALGTPSSDGGSTQPPLHETLWGKSELLLGRISSEISLESAQCCLVASIYLGSKGLVAKSYRWSHLTATKCEALAKMTLADGGSMTDIPDSFRRLYWVAYIWEGDFTSEISIHVPSGMSKFEDLIPYPLFDVESRQHGDDATRKAAELIAFQVSTNVSIRRCLSRVNSMLFNSTEQFRANQSNYVYWLLRTTEDLWTHHTAVYRNIPNFLLTSETGESQSQSPIRPVVLPLLPDRNHQSDLGNRPWNVTRLNGRYYAGQYIIHRPFIEYVLHNSHQYEVHPLRIAILDRCRVCLEGCAGFIGVFDLDQLNSVTCLFSAGIVTFKMVMLLIVATICPAFQPILPSEIEQCILAGKRNMKRFEANVGNFEWHLDVLERLDTARQSIEL